MSPLKGLDFPISRWDKGPVSVAAFAAGSIVSHLSKTAKGGAASSVAPRAWASPHRVPPFENRERWGSLSRGATSAAQLPNVLDMAYR